MGWTVLESNPGGGEILCTCSVRLYHGYRVSFPGIRRPERDVNRPPTSSAEVKERVELCLYSPSVPSWPVLGRSLTVSSTAHRHFELKFLTTHALSTFNPFFRLSSSKTDVHRLRQMPGHVITKRRVPFILQGIT